MKLPNIWRAGRDQWNPSRDINQLQRRVDRLFDDLLMEPSLLRSGPSPFPLWEDTEFAPACDLDETKTQYVLSFDLPGMKKEDIKIDLQDNRLTISGERKEEKKDRVRSEKYYGAFCRSFTLPTNVDGNKIDANYHNGVLHVALPKTAASTGKQIPVKEEKQIEVGSEKVA